MTCSNSLALLLCTVLSLQSGLTSAFYKLDFHTPVAPDPLGGSQIARTTFVPDDSQGDDAFSTFPLSTLKVVPHSHKEDQLVLDKLEVVSFVSSESESKSESESELQLPPGASAILSKRQFDGSNSTTSSVPESSQSSSQSESPTSSASSTSQNSPSSTPEASSTESTSTTSPSPSPTSSDVQSTTSASPSPSDSTTPTPSTSNSPSSSDNNNSPSTSDSTTVVTHFITVTPGQTSVSIPASDSQNDSGSSSGVTVFVTQTESARATQTTGDDSKPSSSKASATGTLATNNDDSNNGGNGGSGLSTKDRNIVIGVVVGVGGFLLLAGLGFVAWRVWLRDGSAGIARKNRFFTEKNEEMAAASTVGGGIGPGVVGGRMSDDASEVDVFRANIDQYHAPRPNAASNF